ncbi:MAG: hypothetical protein AB8I08_05950 [Sandaracinaceae bacterium]
MSQPPFSWLSVRAFLVLATLIGSAALVASGISRLAAARLMLLTSPAAPPTRLDPSPSAESVSEPAISRLFGDVHAQPSAPPMAPDATSDACPGGVALVGLYIDRLHPARSVAALHTEAGSRSLDLGATAEGWLLTSVGPRGVTLEQRGARCELRHGRQPTPAPQDLERTAQNPAEDPRIRAVEAGRFLVQRSLVAELSERPPPLRVVPFIDDGVMRGVRLYGIRRNSIPSQLGLQNGDRVRSLDGVPVEGAEGALEAYGRLLSGESVRVGLVRRGAPLELTVELEG